jgi:putative transposase
MADLFFLSRVQMRRIEGIFRCRMGSRGRRSADRQRNRVWDQERAALARRSARLWPTQDDLQSVRSLEPSGRIQQDFRELARKGGKPERIMIDATHLKAHRTAASLLKKGLFPDVSGAPKAA